MAEVAKNPARLDDHMLSILASRHCSGLDVFASKEPVDREEISDAAIFTLLNRLVESYDMVLVDVPAHLQRKSGEILAHSDFVLVTGLFSVPSVREILGLCRRLRDLEVPDKRIGVAITDTEKNIFGMVSQRFDSKSALGGRLTFFIRRDRDFAMECVDEGKSMMQTQPSRGICQDIAKLAEHLKTVTPLVGLRVETE